MRYCQRRQLTSLPRLGRLSFVSCANDVSREKTDKNAPDNKSIITEMLIFHAGDNGERGGSKNARDSGTLKTETTERTGPVPRFTPAWLRVHAARRCYVDEIAGLYRENERKRKAQMRVTISTWQKFHRANERLSFLPFLLREYDVAVHCEIFV